MSQGDCPLTYPLNPPISTPSPISRAAATNPTVNEIFPPAQYVTCSANLLSVNGVKLSPTSEKTIMSNNVTDPKTAIDSIQTYETLLLSANLC